MAPEKNSLSIRLTEPVVSLRTALERTSRQHDDEILPPAVVRGLLTFEVAKPTKVSSIELGLQAKAITRYTRGGAPTRIDVTEQYKVHSASTVVFKAGSARQERQRAMSTKPRVQFVEQTESGTHDTHFNELGSGRPLDPLSPRVSRPPLSSGDPDMDDSGYRQQERISFDPAPRYTIPLNRRSCLSAESVADRSQSVASSSRIAGSLCSPVLSTSSLTPDALYSSSTSSIALSRTSSMEQAGEDGTENGANCPGNISYYGLSRVTTGSSYRESDLDRRGRSHSRFSFGKVVHVFEVVKDHMRSQSPRAGSRPRSDEQERGRTLMKGKGKAHVSAHGARYALPRIEGAEPSVSDGANEESGDGWVLFPIGTYTYPIFITMPNGSPPTVKADRGSLTWKIKAEVRRPGAFKSKLATQKDVVVVSVPKGDASEEVDGIDLQRGWEGQFQYHIQTAGHGVPVGGKVPFQLTITPLAKIKVHSIMVYLDERTEYYTRAGSLVGSDAIRRATLLVIRHANSNQGYGEPVLPLASDEPEAFRKSPLYRFMGPGEDESEVASSFMGPGPWTIRHQLSVPNSCSILRPSNRTKRSNIMVHHTLKIVLRVEKEEGTTTTGRRKLYDIVIHAPIQILSCRCTSEWTSLPRYDEVLQSRSEGELQEDTSICPCRARLQHVKTRKDPRAVDTSPVFSERTTLPFAVDSNPLDLLSDRTHLRERLMTGLMSERGEAPPPYERSQAVYV